MSFSPTNLLWILAITSLLHSLEEFVWPGGFYPAFKTLVRSRGLDIGAREVIFINILFWVAVVSAVAAGASALSWGLTVCLLVMINGLLHTLISLFQKKYFPGLVSGLLLYIPLGIAAVLQFPLSPAQKWSCLLGATGMHGIPFLLMFLKKIASNN